MGDAEQIREWARQDRVIFTRHAAEEALAEQISESETVEALSNGMILEDYPDEQRGPCCLMNGSTSSERDLHIVVTKGKSPVRVITVYEPRPPHWINPRERGQR